MDVDNKYSTVLMNDAEGVLDKRNTVVQITQPTRGTIQVNFEHIKRAGSALCLGSLGYLMTISFLTFCFVIPLAQLIIGILYKNQCPINDSIPTYLISSGIIGLVFGVISLYQVQDSFYTI
jgi:hypothetical protein